MTTCWPGWPGRKDLGSCNSGGALVLLPSWVMDHGNGKGILIVETVKLSAVIGGDPIYTKIMELTMSYIGHMMA